MSYRALDLIGVLLSLVIVAPGCGQVAGKLPFTQPQASEKNATEQYPLSSKSRWNVVTKACGDTVLTSEGDWTPLAKR